METLTKAIKYAEKKHGNQMYGDKPYMYHLNAVAKILMDARFDDETILSIAYLHDILEDTNVTANELSDEFGYEITEAVVLLTNSIRNRHKSLVGMGMPSVVKVADRIANQQACIETGNIGLGFKYLKDYKHIKKLHAGETLNSQLEKTYKILYKMLRDAFMKNLGITRQAFSQWVMEKNFPKYASLERLKEAGIEIL